LWHDVGPLDDFERGRLHLVTADGREVGIVRWEDKVSAMRTVCPHQLASLISAMVRPRLRCAGPLSPVEADTLSPTISCPWHGWEFDLSTGRPIWDPKGPGLRIFPAEIRDGRVLVELGGRSAD
jgi:nitrite reductase/ring-hydroxylating ferredoxin subunit